MDDDIVYRRVAAVLLHLIQQGTWVRRLCYTAVWCKMLRWGVWSIRAIKV